MSVELPKRSDDIYKEIESFKDYEFTNCIAYEMAIRNDEVKKKRLDFNVFNFKSYDKAYEELKKRYYLSKEIIHQLSYKKKEIKALGTLDNIENGVEELFLFLQSNNLLMKIFNLPEFNEKIPYEMKGKSKEYDEFLYFCDKEIKYLTLEEMIKYSDYLCFYGYAEGTKYTCGIFKELDIVALPLEFINIKKNDFFKSPKIKNDFFSRPKLSIPKKLDKTIELNINPNLPKDELIAYISKIKDEYDKDNSIIKSPLELLNQDLEKADNKKINKKLIADKFFIYDYITVRQEQIEQMNEEIIQEYEEKIQELKNIVIGKDRIIQEKELRRELSEDIINTKVDDIFKEIKNFTPATAKRYYYDIKPFIDDCKYKELITGVKQ